MTATTPKANVPRTPSWKGGWTPLPSSTHKGKQYPNRVADGQESELYCINATPKKANAPRTPSQGGKWTHGGNGRLILEPPRTRNPSINAKCLRPCHDISDSFRLRRNTKHSFHREKRGVFEVGRVDEEQRELHEGTGNVRRYKLLWDWRKPSGPNRTG